MSQYTYEDKKKLLKSIEKIEDRKCLKKISQIIVKLNPDHPMSVNESGTSLYFDNLNEKTYKKLEEYVSEYLEEMKSRNKKYKKKKLSDIVDVEDHKRNEELKKFTNSEATMIRRREFDESINVEHDKLIISDQEYNTIMATSSQPSDEKPKKKRGRKKKTVKN